MEFKKIQPHDKNKILSYVADEDVSWEYSVGCFGVWGKGEAYVSCDFGVPILYMDFGDAYIFSPPYTKDKELFSRVVLASYDYCKTKGVKFVMKGLDKEYSLLFSNDFKVKTSLNDGDYIYEVSKIASLAGKKYHSKRNFVNRFEKLYISSFEKYSPEYYESAISLLNRWCALHDNSEFEAKAIKYAFENYSTLGLDIYLIVINGEVAAFSIIDISGKVAHYLFEKADIRYEGVYQAINCYTCRELVGRCEIVNRQEDMGNEGLRKAKQSYHPTMILEKYTLTK